MSRHRIHRFLRLAVDAALAASLAALAYGALWEYSTRAYLRGFADAVIPHSAEPEEKVEAILAWMAQPPERYAALRSQPLSLRNPQITLNYTSLLAECGTATNAFVNLAQTAGVRARRLLLIGPHGGARHVAAEVWIEGRWVVADPLYHLLYRRANGEFVTKEELRDPRVLREVTRAIPDYPFTYEETQIVRLAAIPLIGVKLRPVLDRLLPGWEEHINWTLVLERESFAFLLAAILALCGLLAVRLFLVWYGHTRSGAVPEPLSVRSHPSGATSVRDST